MLLKSRVGKTLINFLELKDNLKTKKISNFYIFCGFNEQTIKEDINSIAEICVDKSFKELNYVELDGNKVNCDDIVNACETLPIMSNKRIVVIYRADFFNDKKKGINKNGEEIIKSLYNYSVPEHCILIIYYVFDNDREKVSSKVRKFDKKAAVVEFTKLKGMALQKKVKDIFDEKHKNIGRAELSLFCSEVENNMDIIKNEVEKLCEYTKERDITKEDILELLPQKSDNDIFNLVDFLSQKKPEKALEVLDELLYRGEKPNFILSMIERQFRLMFNIKLGTENGKKSEELSKELRLNPYICEKMLHQCKKYSIDGIVKAEELCIKTESDLKSQGSDQRVKLELLIINSSTI